MYDSIFRNTHDPGTGRLATIGKWHINPNWREEFTTRTYDLSGNADWAAFEQRGPLDEQNVGVARWKGSRSFYAADERLRYFQERDLRGGTMPKHDGVWEEYRYDPLGRRILVNTRTKDLCNTGTAFQCASATTRMVWAGDQLIWELRQASQSPGEVSGPADAYGTVSYMHAGGIDRPLVITKKGESVLPHQNWCGQFTRGTYASGASSDCAPGHLDSDQERRRNNPMNGETDPDDAAEAVRTRDDFAAFVRLLLRGLSSSGEAWENDTLPRFLEALAACSDDLAHAWNQGRPLPVSPTWPMFAELLNSARIYE